MTYLSKDKLINEIKKEEGKITHNGRHVMYFDHLGNPTIGWGRLISEGGGLTDDEAEQLLMNDINRIIKQMDDNMLWWRGESDVRKRALIQMAFQMGIRGLLSFNKMLWAMQHGNYKEAYREALNSKWAEQTPERAMRVAKMIREGYD